ncbi:hypothetical protein NE237_020875 [Protea cynaroides]|uniref:Uncharacterized protein n=1 Tax=Protea cynaroides TaxID=273540 RepID=A0A9Q0K3V1_9MAGN|nr:hypothetical protein NE237_020875 [Protea cynaroides]
MILAHGEPKSKLCSDYSVLAYTDAIQFLECLRVSIGIPSDLFLSVDCLQKMSIMRINGLLLLVTLLGLAMYGVESGNHQPLARIVIHKARINALEASAFVTASPTLLGLGYQYVNYSTADYIKTVNGTLSFLMINQRADFAFALFSGGLYTPKLIAMSNTIAFAYPNAPLYPRLVQGMIWNEPNSGSFYRNSDSGGECGVLAKTMFYVPTTNKDNFWYSTDYGMFQFCVADNEHDWRPGTPQCIFLENCLASVDRHRQPRLIFIAHKVLGYTSSYLTQGTSGEPMGRDSLQQLWQKYKGPVGNQWETNGKGQPSTALAEVQGRPGFLGLDGHVHNYKRTCPVYESICTMTKTKFFQGSLNGTIHVVAGGAGQSLSPFGPVNTTWSVSKDYDWGFVKLTAFNHTTMLMTPSLSSGTIRPGSLYF